MGAVQIDTAVLGALRARLTTLAQTSHPRGCQVPDHLTPSLRSTLEELYHADRELSETCASTLRAAASRIERLSEGTMALDRFHG